jgi:signal transduction histidine kinase
MAPEGDIESEIAALEHGASDIVLKPVREELLMLAVKRAEEKTAFGRHLRDCTRNLEQARKASMEDKRLATIGEAVAGLAHYLKNILTGLRGGMYMVNTGTAKDKPHMKEEGWAMVQRNVQNLADLVSDVLRYVKEGIPEKNVCRPNEIVSEVVELMKTTAEQHEVKLDMVLDPNLGEAFIDRNGIRNVLLNLVSNGIDACIYDTDTSKSWQVTVTSELVADAKSGQSILFRVTDNGMGMTDEVKSQLYTRFFSTKGGRGTGLGLLGSQKIIEEHGGVITVESTVGQGSIFSVQLEHKMPPEN